MNEILQASDRLGWLLMPGRRIVRIRAADE
jgi:hypothetical protein